MKLKQRPIPYRGESAESAFGLIIYAGEDKLLGLYRRRMDEATIFDSGIYERTYRDWPS